MARADTGVGASAGASRDWDRCTSTARATLSGRAATGVLADWLGVTAWRAIRSGSTAWSVPIGCVSRGLSRPASVGPTAPIGDEDDAQPVRSRGTGARGEGCGLADAERWITGAAAGAVDGPAAVRRSAASRGVRAISGGWSPTRRETTTGGWIGAAISVRVEATGGGVLGVNPCERATGSGATDADGWTLTGAGGVAGDGAASDRPLGYIDEIAGADASVGGDDGGVADAGGELGDTGGGLADTGSRLTDAGGELADPDGVAAVGDGKSGDADGEREGTAGELGDVAGGSSDTAGVLEVTGDELGDVGSRLGDAAGELADAGGELAGVGRDGERGSPRPSRR